MKFLLAGLLVAAAPAWLVEEVTDPLTDVVSQTATTQGETGKIDLQIRCMSGDLYVAFLLRGGSIAAGRGRATDVLVRGDNLPAAAASGLGKNNVVIFDERIHADFPAVWQAIAGADDTIRVRIFRDFAAPVDDSFVAADIGAISDGIKLGCT